MEPYTGSKPIEKISLGNHDVRILNQSKKGEWIELVLDSESKDLRSKQLLFDGRHMEWESISQADFVGPLKDGKSGRQVISAKFNQAVNVRFIPTGEFLYDSEGVRYTFKKSTKAGDALKIKLRLHEDVEKNLDEDETLIPWTSCSHLIQSTMISLLISITLSR